MCVKTKEWVRNPTIRPGKVETLALSARYLSILRYIDLFKISKNDCLFRIFVNENGGGEALVVVNGEPFDKVVDEIHQSIGHGGHKSVDKIMRRKYYSPGMSNLIKERLSGCITCIKYNIPRTIRHKYSTLVPAEARAECQIDLIGPLPKSGAGFRFILNLTDSLTREIHLRALRTTSADEMSDAICKLFGEIGLYRTIRADYKCFSLKAMDMKCINTLGIELIRSNNTSRAQGIVERSNQQTTIRVLKMLNNDANLGRWSEVLRSVSLGISLCPNRSLGFLCPADLVRRFPTHFLGPGTGSIPKGMKDGFRSLVTVMEMVRKGALINLIGHKSYLYPSENLETNTIVFKKRMSFSRHQNQKLQVKILEAYKIVSKVASGIYEARNLVTGEIRVLPVDQMVRTMLKEQDVLKILTDLNNS